MGLLNNVVPFCLVVWGQSHIASGLAAILNATTPISTVIVAHVLTDDEKISGNRLVGVATGFFGVVVLIGPDSLNGLGTSVLAQIAVLTAAVFYAFAAVYGRRFKAMGIDPILTATGQVTASAVMLFPIAMLVDHPWTLPMPAPSAWAAIIGSATLSTALGYVLYFRILSTAGATNLLLVTFMIPVSAIIMGNLRAGRTPRRQAFHRPCPDRRRARRDRRQTSGANAPVRPASAMMLSMGFFRRLFRSR
jgi:drug/metabolite transporter (DMT)-like permease